MRKKILNVAGAGTGIALARLAKNFLDAQKWERKHRDGTAVSLLGGLETAAGVLAASAVFAKSRLGSASFCAGLAGGVAGWIDDHFEAAFSSVGKGFHGHIGALRKGKLTSGMLKIVLIGAGAAVSSLILETDGKKIAALPQSKFEQMLQTLMHTGIDTVIIAGSANLLNLLDLRPGRALKAGVIFVLPAMLLGRSNAGNANHAPELSLGLIAVSAAGLPKDLKGETMLGDLGANALGGAIGVLIADACNVSKTAKLGAAAVLVGLTALSEKISFSQIIENTPVLREFDQLGRAAN